MPLLRRLAANPRFELEACRQAANSGHQCTRVSLQILFKIYVCLFGCLLTWLILHHRMIAQCRFPYSDTRISRVQSSRVWIHFASPAGAPLVLASRSAVPRIRAHTNHLLFRLNRLIPCAGKEHFGDLTLQVGTAPRSSARCPMAPSSWPRTQGMSLTKRSSQAIYREKSL